MNDDDTLSILIATDNHLGYLERDPIRGQDSFDAFSEILQLAHIRKVDMVLLGGDMFHDNKPSRKCLHQALALLRQHCMGDSPVSVEYLSDPLVDFGAQFPHVNYEDPNLNIALPVFSIHGNHDDPSGDGNLSAMDMLSVGGLVNYFGRQSEVDNIRVSPVLLRKGRTRLALYGLGNVRDERLHRTIARKHMTMCQPAEDTDKWFNLMVLHQNRVPHGPKNHIPEHFLSDFLDLVIWGHEHQCQVDPEYNPRQSFYVSQPGSSVATALSSGEAVEKHVAVLRINQRNFKLEKVRLKNVRPFIIEDVVLSQVASLSPQSTEDEIVEYLRLKVEAMIVRAQQKYQEQLEDSNAQIDPALGENPKPLIRVRVEYSGGFESFHPQRFGLLFADRVANPRDIIYFYRKARPATTRVGATEASDLGTQGSSRAAPSVPAPLEAVRVESLISEFLDDSSMQMLVDVELAEAIRLFVQKGDGEAITQSLKRSIDDTQKQIMATGAGAVSEGALDKQIAEARLVRRKRAVESGQGLVDSKGDDVAVTVQLNAKKSAINTTDRKAIQAFERVAAAAAVASRTAPSTQTAVNYDEDEAGRYEDESQSGESDNDDDLRDAGEELNAKGGARRATAKKPAAQAKSRALPLTLDKRARIASRSTNIEDEPDNNNDDDEGDSQVDSDHGDENSEFEEAKYPPAPARKPAAQISRPSRSARSTRTTRSSSAVSIASSADDNDNENDNDAAAYEERTQPVPRTRTTRSTRTTRAASKKAEDSDRGSEEISDDGDDVAEPVSAPKKRRANGTAATGTAERAARAATASRSRGRGRGARATGAATKLKFTQQSQSNIKSQLPAVDLDDDDSDGGGSTGFGKFTLRKK
ncbi:DNA repair exonuclease [Martensiomyces pterosporus]|nr:DNA repair exonuclease [Martensiomyces pterosporus]